MSGKTEKYLVLCVDRDDDLGKKAKVKSPVTGREAIVEAAAKLALADPEEADSNAMFAAVRRYDELRRRGVECEVAVICGHEDGGFEADRNMKVAADSVVNATNSTGIVLVSDGGEDEQVIPILQGIRPVVSIERVAIKHSETVEQNYLILGRYLRMLVFDPRYSKWALGLPGLVFLIGGALILSDLVFEAELATLLILGGAFIVRGFNVDRTVAGILQRGPYGYMRLFSAVTGVLVFLVGVSTGYTFMANRDPSLVNAVAGNPSLFFVYGPRLAGDVINGSILFVWAGVAIYSLGAILSHVARESPRWRRDAEVMVILAFLYFPVETFSEFLMGGQSQSPFLLVSYVTVGLALIFLASITVYPRVRPKGGAAE